MKPPIQIYISSNSTKPGFEIQIDTLTNFHENRSINNLLSNTHNNKSEYLATMKGPLQTLFIFIFIFSTRET